MTPLLAHWSYVFLALTHRHDEMPYISSVTEYYRSSAAKMEHKTTFDLTWAIHPISCHYWWPMEFVFSTLNTGNATRFHKISKAILTHWGRDKMAVVSQTTLSNAFSWMKMLEFRWRFHWSLFLRVQLTIFQHWFRYWLGAGQATSHYLNQWWLFYWRIYASLGLNELNVFKILYCHRNFSEKIFLCCHQSDDPICGPYICVCIYSWDICICIYIYISVCMCDSHLSCY